MFGWVTYHARCSVGSASFAFLRGENFRQDISRRTRVSNALVDRKGYGVLMFGYGPDAKTAIHFAKMAVVAAGTFKKFSPSLPLAIVSSLDKDEVELDGIFDHVIRVREDLNFAGSDYQKRGDGLSRQWLTRLLYLSATPFELTIAYDANVFACADIMPAIQKLQDTDFDFAAASTGPSNKMIYPHNFALAYKWSTTAALLLDEWFMEQVSTGVALDDQHTLKRATSFIQKHVPSFKLRLLNPVLASAFVSTRPSRGFWPRETRVIKGGSLVIHGDPAQADSMCEIFNTDVVPRQVVNIGHGPFVVHSAAECRQRINTSAACLFDALWDESGENLVPDM